MKKLRQYILKRRALRQFRRNAKKPEAPEKVVIMKGKTRCNFCKTKYVNLAERWSCRYCNSYHCSKHRLPTDHRCKKAKNPHKSGGRVVYKR